MLMFKLFIVCSVIVVGALSVEAADADMEIKLVDKNCWREVWMCPDRLIRTRR